MNKKRLYIFGTVLLLILSVYQLMKNEELEKLGAVLDDYSKVDKIRILIEDNRAVEVNDNGPEMLEELKDNLFPMVLLSERQDKKLYESSLGDKVYEINFYVGNKIVFTELIYKLTDEFPSTSENSFKIGNQHYIAKWKKSFIKLQMDNPDFLQELTEVQSPHTDTSD